MNAGRIRTTLVPRSERPVGEGVLIEERSLSSDASRVRKNVTLRDPEGREESWREDVQLFEPEALDRLVARAGFATVSRRGDFDGSPFEASAPRQLVWIERT